MDLFLERVTPVGELATRRASWLPTSSLLLHFFVPVMTTAFWGCSAEDPGRRGSERPNLEYRHRHDWGAAGGGLSCCRLSEIASQEAVGIFCVYESLSNKGRAGEQVCFLQDLCRRGEADDDDDAGYQVDDLYYL